MVIQYLQLHLFIESLYLYPLTVVTNQVNWVSVLSGQTNANNTIEIKIGLFSALSTFCSTQGYDQALTNGTVIWSVSVCMLMSYCIRPNHATIVTTSVLLYKKLLSCINYIPPLCNKCFPSYLQYFNIRTHSSHQRLLLVHVQSVIISMRSVEMSGQITYTMLFVTKNK